MYFTSNLNKTAWALKKKLNITWGDALRMAIRLGDLPTAPATSDSSVFGEWKPENHGRVAGHFWGLGKAYDEIGDKGRSIAMTRVAKTFYAMRDQMETATFKGLLNEKFFGKSVMEEVIEFFAASGYGTITPRSRTLIEAGATEYASRLIAPAWTF